MKIFIERLKELRTFKKLSQTQLGELVGVSQSSIAKWENGERTPLIVYLPALAKALETTADYLVGLTDVY